MKLTPQQKKLLLAIHYPEVAKIINQQETNEILKRVNMVKGDKGYTPIKGVDYNDGKNAEVNYPLIINEVVKKIPVPKDGISPTIDYKKIIDSVIPQIPIPENGKDGINPEIDYDKIVSDVVSKIPKPKDGKDAEIKDELITKALEPHIKNLHSSISRAIDGMPRGSNYGGFIETQLKAGNNVTISKDATGAWVVASTGGGGGTWYEEVLTYSDGTHYTLAHTPTSIVLLYLNGQKLTVGTEYTRITTAITLISPALASDILVAVYS